PLFDGQWYLDYLQIEELFEQNMGNSSIKIAVIDSGIDIYHPDLQNKIIAPIDVVDADDDPSPRPGDYCFNGQVGICDTHGTAVAGIALAQADNDAGMVGVCPECSLVPIRMLGEGAPLSADIAAFQHAFDQGVDVINNSWGYNVSMPVPTPLADVIQRVASEGRNGKGTVIVFAAGNEDREIQPDELCAMEEVLCISAIDSYERPTQYTNYGSGIDLTAPSATVSIAPNDQSTTNFGGTSAAAPIVSGLIGWLLSEDPTLSRAEVHNILIDTAIPSPLVSVDENGHHPFYGYGVISPKNLLDKLYPAEDPKPSGCRTVPLDFPLCTFIVLFLFRRR
ncbi:MAG: S8 family serine peptidase, partial [Myxococcota bacterium]|nr:S8 family serine peptidase [Myxococcota bacterium]